MDSIHPVTRDDVSRRGPCLWTATSIQRCDPTDPILYRSYNFHTVFAVAQRSKKVTRRADCVALNLIILCISPFDPNPVLLIAGDDISRPEFRPANRVFWSIFKMNSIGRVAQVLRLCDVGSNHIALDDIFRRVLSRDVDSISVVTRDDVSRRGPRHWTAIGVQRCDSTDPVF